MPRNSTVCGGLSGAHAPPTSLGFFTDSAVAPVLHPTLFVLANTPVLYASADKVQVRPVGRRRVRRQPNEVGAAQMFNGPRVRIV